MCVLKCESLYKRARLCGYWCVCVRVFVTICIHVKLVKYCYIRICVIECAWHESVHVLCVHVSV